MITLEQLENLSEGDIVYKLGSQREAKFVEYDDEVEKGDRCDVKIFFPDNESEECFDRRDLSLQPRDHGYASADYKNYNKNKEESPMKAIKEYAEKHRDLLITIGVVLILDHFVFSGAFTEKLKKIVDGFLDKKVKEVSK